MIEKLLVRLAKFFEIEEEEVAWTVQGFITSGPDQTLGFAGWKVHAHEKEGVNVPVLLVAYRRKA